MSATITDFDVARFADWLAEQTGQAAPVTVTPMRGGGSCEMFRIQRLGQAWVLRRAPVIAVSDTAHQVTREALIMKMLGESGFWVPTVLAGTEDPGVVGAPFFVMSYVEGVVIRHSGLPDSLCRHPASHGRIGEGLIDTLVALHAVPWRDTALADLSHPQGFLDRQVDRWMTQLAGYRIRDLDGVDELASWLHENAPAGGDLTVMHGDYKIDNVIWSPTPPPQIACVVDFEMTTVGDPLIDLAWAMIFWPEAGNLFAFASPEGPNGIDRVHCQRTAALVQRYADETGRDLSHFGWYQAFSAWKLAIVMEGSYVKYLQGQSRNPLHESFGAGVDHLLIRAQRFAR